MPRNINPVPQYLRLGLPVEKGRMFYFKAGTREPLDTFKDAAETPSKKNEHPVRLTPNGELPNVFFTGTAKQVLTTADGLHVFERDPVGGENQLGDFALYDNTVVYDLNDKVEALDGKFYISLSNVNQGNDPITVNSKWSEIRFLGVYNAAQSYSIGEVVQESDGSLWRSIVALNLGNTPSSSSTKWLPAVLGVDIPEVIALEIRTTTVIQHTGGGVLSALRVNQLQDAGAYVLPLASAINDGQILTVELPVTFAAFQPTVARSGSDTITDDGGTDTDVLFDTGTSVSVDFMSDGVSDWSI